MKFRLPPRPAGGKHLSLAPKQGMVLISFLGRGNNQRSYYGKSGTRYVFGGARHRAGYVYEGDVEALAKMTDQGKALFERVKVPELPKMKPVKEAWKPVEPVEVAPVKVRKPRAKKAAID